MAHCNLTIPFQEVYAPYVMSGGSVIPFDITIDGENISLEHAFSDELNAMRGDRIVAINGRPISFVLEGITRLISADNRALAQTSIETIGFPRFFWLAYGEVKQFSVTFQKTDGAQIDVKVDAIPATQFEQKQGANPSFINTAREFRFIGTTAYFRPGSFLNNEASIDISAHDTFNRGEFIQFLDTAFHDIVAKQPPCLIIDLRGNPGGDNSFSDPMVAYFANVPFHFCSSFDLRTSGPTKTFWKGVSDPGLSELRKQILEHRDGERFSFEMPLYQPRTEGQRYHGKVYIMINRFTYSNAVSVAAIVQDYHFGTIVGQPTTDAPSTYGAAQQFDLPHTHFAVMYPKALIIRPSGEKDPHGVIPDHLIPDDKMLQSEDEMLGQVIALAKEP